MIILICILFCVNYIMKKFHQISTTCFQTLFCLVADLFSLAGDGDGGGTILGLSTKCLSTQNVPYAQTIMFVNPK